MMMPTRCLTVLSSPPCGTMTSTETAANSSILAFTAQPAVWPIHVLMASWHHKTESYTAYHNTQKHQDLLITNMYV